METIMSLMAAVTLFFTPQSSIAQTVTVDAPQSEIVNTICIDAGHGGEDPGAINGNLTEAEVNLNIAKRLKLLLEKNDYRVVMTREDNESELTNSERATICNKNNTDLLISIHLNSSINYDLNYTQGLYGDEDKDKELTTILHEELLSGLSIGYPPEDAVTDFHSNLMLKANMPATLQETVFISSPTEYSLLSDGTRQQQIAESLYKGINKWSNQVL